MEHANASECGALMDCAPAWMKINTPYKLWQYKEGDLSDDVGDFNRAIMDFGTRMEPIARAWLSEQVGIHLDSKVFEENINTLSYSASLDGYGESAGEDFTVKAEIKCPATGEKSKTWKAAADNEILPYYYWQVVHQEMVCPTTKTYFAVFVEGAESVIIDMDEAVPGWKEDVAVLKSAWELFFAEPPAPDWEEMEDMAAWSLAESDFAEAKQALADAEKGIKFAKEALIGLTNTHQARGLLVEVSKRHRKGAIKYKDVPEIKGINLEPYRGNGSDFWDVRLRK
jgi:putative phage-type endonuclease